VPKSIDFALIHFLFVCNKFDRVNTAVHLLLLARPCRKTDNRVGIFFLCQNTFYIKKLVLFALFVGAGFCAKAQSTERFPIKVRVRPRHGVGCTLDWGLCVIVTANKEAAPSNEPAMGTATATLLDDKHLSLTFDQAGALDKSNVVPISNTLILSDAFGYKEVDIQPGDYKAQVSEAARYGTVVVDVVVKK